jgi:hypothetical protein
VDFSGKALDDTWTWDGTNWIQQQPLHTPGSRGDAVIAYDSPQHRAFLFGGSNATTAFGDTWAWDGTDWISLGQAMQPDPRTGEALAYDPRQENTIMFGGVFTFGISNETWKWDGSTWTHLQPPIVPPARGYTPLVDDPEVGRLVIFGGFGAGGVLNDTWSWDGTSWIQEHPAHSPSARTSPQLAFDGTHLLLYGGYDGHGTVFGDTWTWDGQDWTQLMPATSPPPLNAGAIAYDPIRHQVVLFGGSTGGGVNAVVSANVGVPIAETWTWDGINWTQQHPTHSPPAIAQHTMVFDNNLGGIALFNGGQAAPGPDTVGSKGFYNNELWLWNGVDWIQVVTTTVPGPRGAEGLACDARRHALVLYAGNGAHGVQGDTWTFAPLPVELTSVVSRKTHGNAGAFDVDLTNGNGIECRSGGTAGDYTVVFTFENTLTTVGSVNVTSGSGSVASSTIDTSDAHNYIVNLTGVGNAQRIVVSLINVTDSLGDFSSTIAGGMGVLVGDVNASKRVDAADVSAVRQQTLQTITNSNFREDVNASGRVDAADVSIARQQTLTSLP